MVVRRPLCVGGEMEGGGLLKGDLDLLGLGGDVLVERTGMRDGLGEEVVTGGEGGWRSTTTAAGPVWSSSSLRRPAGRVLVAAGTVIGCAGELSTGREGLGEGLGACRLAL